MMNYIEEAGELGRKGKAALRLVEHGFWVLPIHTPKGEAWDCSCGRPSCDRVGKHPWTMHGWKDASNNPQDVRAWWAKNRNANVAIATDPSRLLVVDVDERKNGFESLWRLWESHGRFPRTAVASTGGGGAHFFFRVNEVVTSTAGKLGEGLDVRSRGGIVVAAPSLHSTGGVYSWTRAPWDQEIASAPAWLVERSTNPSASKGRSWRGHSPIAEGLRNDTLYNLATKLSVRGVDADTVAAAVEGVNASRCKPPLGETEVRGIVSRATSRPDGFERKNIRLLSYEEFVRWPDPDWLVRGMLPLGVTMLIGESGIGKSMLAIDLACSVATGRPWLGESVTQGSVVYIAAEGASGLKVRVGAWSTENSESLEDFHVVGGAVSLTDGVAVSDLFAEAARLEIVPRLVVIDTLARCMAGEDENSAQSMGRVVEACDRMVSEWDCCVLVVHHPPKGAKTIARGSGALRGAVNAELVLERRDGNLILSNQKQKDAEEFRPKYLELVPAHGSAIVRTIDSREAAKGKQLRADTAFEALALLHSKTGNAISYGEWKAAFAKSESSFVRARNDLLADGRVQQIKEGYIPSQQSMVKAS